VPDISLYTSGYRDSTAENGLYVQRDKQWCHTLAKTIENILLENPAILNEPVLDVGCNGGELVEQLVERRIIAEGCDVDPIALAHGRNKGLPVFHYDLSSQKLRKLYGLIVLNHTLEHIVPASEMINNIYESLLPGGVLYIRVPNFSGWIARMLKEKWGFLVPQEHVWQFAPSTLKSFIKAKGKFQAIEIHCKSNLEYPGIGIKGWVKEFIKSAAVQLNRGDEIIASFRKT